jgi:tRNA threonylcarbamoyladenosine biosynthesis protein TsaE
MEGRWSVVSSTLSLLKTPAWSVTVSSEEETRALARRLGALLRAGDFIALMGDLGAGKTVFIQGVAQAQGGGSEPTSPTFALIHYHPAQGSRPFLRHVDLYRLSGPEVPALEWEELLDDRGITLVEWADKARLFWPSQVLPVRLVMGPGATGRHIHFFNTGARASALLAKLREKP